jgi:hypothetical protein
MGNVDLEGHGCTKDPNVESLARDLMAETGEWKETIRDRSDGKNPIIVTRRGDCVCEVRLPNGKHHPDWEYKVRTITDDERAAFKEEYGNVAPLLLGMPMGTDYEIRGFVLNGRIKGWNLSAKKRSLEPHS